MGSDLNSIIRYRAECQPSDIAFQIIGEPNEPYAVLTYADLLGCAQLGWARLQNSGIRTGDRIILSLPTGRELITALLGAFWGGVTPTIMAPLQKDFQSQCSQRLAILNTRAVVTDLTVEIPGLMVLPSSAFSGVNDQASEPAVFDGHAYIQFSSGSTGSAKGIALEWSAITSNLQSMADRLSPESLARSCSWLPLYHDMGLFGGLLLPLYVGGSCHLMDSAQFRRNPLRWLRILSDAQSTLAVAPPSALLAVIRLLKRSRDLSLDLGSLVRFVVGAELVSHQLIEAYDEILVQQHSARPEALKPVYGLAESTLAVTIPHDQNKPLIDWIDPDVLMSAGMARRSDPAGGNGFAVVSTGPPIQGQEITIRDAAGQILPDRTVGNVWIRSPSLLSGLYNQGGFVAHDGEWLDTGDRAYISSEQLYIIGREKDIIIKHGRNLYPDTIEQIALKQDGVRRAIAFGIYDPGLSSERLILLVEYRDSSSRSRDKVRLAIRSDLIACGYEVDEIHLVDRQALPITTSGKPRRAEAKAMFLRGDLAARQGQIGKR